MLTAGNKLIDNNLRRIGKITELCFPDYQCVGRGRGKSILECKYRHFGQERIIDGETLLILGQFLQRNMRFARLLVIQNGMAMGKGTSPYILSGDANFIATGKNTRIGKRLRKSLVNWQFRRRHPGPITHELPHLPLQVKVTGHFGQLSRKYL